MRGKKKCVFKFKKRVKIIRYGYCTIYLFKDKPVDYWYCRIYANDLLMHHPPGYNGNISNKFKDIAPYFEYKGMLIIYHDMALKLICKKLKELDDKYYYDYWYGYTKKPKKKRRIKNESIRDPKFNYLRCYLRLRSYRSRH